MKEFLKKNFAIVLAFLLPILLIVIVALTTYLPSRFISTDYNFIYTSCGDGNYRYGYSCYNLPKLFSVVDGKLEENQMDMTLVNVKEDLNGNGIPDYNEKYNARIFLHDTEKNEGREITLEEAKLLALNGLLTSPDGVTVSSNYNRGSDLFFFPFGGGSRSSYGYYLTKGKSKSKLNLINSNDQYYYQNNFQFLGWVLPGRN
ncbi:hypothetical protein HYZ82_02030 [Candidatus Nomurabacteria bacterium]|nr:hypothetical protein [Candidatus Nomurabacteria bacterium]